MQISKHTLISAIAAWVLAVVAGCSLIRTLDVEPVAKSVQPPGNVAIYLSVKDGAQPLTDLTEQNFRIYEDGQLIAPEQSQQTLLSGEAVVLHKTLLLVDMSTARDPAIRSSIARGAAGFVAQVLPQQAVTVMAFDGRPDPVAIGEFAKGGSAPAEISELSSFQSSDPSRNLHGAMVKALQELDARLMTDKKPVRVGSLVVMTTGGDLAGRWSYEGLRNVLDKSTHRVFAIGVGPKEKGFSLDDLARAGTARAPSLTSVGVAFDQIAARVNEVHKSFYLLSYCSPARDGRRLLKIEVVRRDQQGNETKGTLYEEIDAVGFGGGCTASTTPRFGAAALPEAGAVPEQDSAPPPAVEADAATAPALEPDAGG